METENNLTEAQIDGLKLFKQLREKLLQEERGKAGGETYISVEHFESWMIHQAHEMWRNKEISSEVFACVVDETICY